MAVWSAFFFHPVTLYCLRTRTEGVRAPHTHHREKTFTCGAAESEGGGGGADWVTGWLGREREGGGIPRAMVHTTRYTCHVGLLLKKEEGTVVP